MKRFASVLAAVLFTMLLAAPVFATDFVPSVARPNPVVVNELPDPNDPDAPDFVTVEDENGEQEPENFVRVEDPESEDPEDPGITPMCPKTKCLWPPAWMTRTWAIWLRLPLWRSPAL